MCVLVQRGNRLQVEAKRQERKNRFGYISVENLTARDLAVRQVRWSKTQSMIIIFAR